MKTIVIQVKVKMRLLRHALFLDLESTETSCLSLLVRSNDPGRLEPPTNAWRWLDLFPINSSLLGGIPIPPKNMKVSWDYEIPNIWNNKTCSKPPSTVQHGKFRFELYLMASLTKHDKPIGGSPHLATSF